MATPEELRQWREAAVAANDKEDVAAIDAELAKVKPATFDPLEEAYADKREAIAAKAPRDIHDMIDTRIEYWLERQKMAERRQEIEGMSGLGQLGAGLASELKNVGLHAKELAHEVLPFAGETTPVGAEGRAKRAEERAKFAAEEAPLSGTLPGFAGGVIGQAIGTAPIAAVAGPAGKVLSGAIGMGMKGLPVVRYLAPPATVLSSTLAGAGMGGLMSEPEDRLKNALIGGAIGAATGTGQYATEKVAQPGFKVDPAAKRLQELNVEGMTGGQMAPGSTVAQVEQVAESGPYGAPIRLRRQELPTNLEQRMLQEGYPPGFQSKLPPGSSAFDAIEELRNEYARRYGQLLDTQPVPKNAIQQDLLKHAYGPSKYVMTPDQRREAVNIIIDKAGLLDERNDARTLHQLYSDLRAEQRMSRSTPKLARHLGDAAEIVDKHLEEAMKASENPANYAEYAALREPYRNFKTLEKAAGHDTATGIILTPDKVSSAVKNKIGPEAFARGEGGTLRELAQLGKQVLAERPGTKTGASLNLATAIPNIGPIQTGPWVLGMMGRFSANHPDLALGQTLPQRALQYTLAQPGVAGTLNQVERAAILHFLERQRQEKPAPTPGAPNAP